MTTEEGGDVGRIKKVSQFPKQEEGYICKGGRRKMESGEAEGKTWYVGKVE